MELNSAIDQYILSRSKRLAQNTLKTYQRNLYKFAQFIGETVSISSITDEMIEDFQLSLKTYLKESTQVNYVNTLRKFFKYWKGRGESQVAWELLEGPRIAEHIPNHITLVQFELIDEYLDEDHYDQLTQKLIFQLLWNTGMRISELLDLNLSDIHVQQNYAKVLTKKSKKVRLVKWNDECHRLLIKYLGIRISLNQRPELFQSPSYTKGRRTRLTSRSVQRWCQQMTEELDFKINPHAFRHGKMHYILNMGGRRHDIKEIAGHSSITSSEVYTRLNPMEQSKVLDQFLPESKEVKYKESYRSLYTSTLNN